MPMCWRARCSMLRRIQTRQPARADASAARPSFRASHATLRADLASSWKALFRSTAARHRIEAAKARTDMREWQIKRSEEHTYELQSLMRLSYALFCLKKQLKTNSSSYLYS